ncbi:MAG: (Fe-S)-binding protein [Candidatus Lokiarchaeota archaeon]|nr:(Fe-S)-binding protein [Candidatus Lokiarchaeota archaeon]
MDQNNIINSIHACKDCKTCMEYCDTFIVSNDEFKSPNGRLKIAEKVFINKEITEEELIGLYTCTLCALCDLACPQDILISEIIHYSKMKLVEQNRAPLSIHTKIIKGIIEKDNSVNGNPNERLDWLPEEYKDEEVYENKDSDTLLFFGCMSSFRVKESASAAYKILKESNYDFKIFESEPCCGEYIYSAGNLNLAKKVFQTNLELFRSKGIKNLIVTCGGCLYAFDKVYPLYFNEYKIKVRHIIDVIYELENKKKIDLTPLNKSITYHDPCRLGRKYKSGPLYTEPRALLRKCGIEVKELAEEHNECPCCGAGSGIRGVDNSISIKIGKQLFDKVNTEEIVSSCPLCVFNFRYVNYKNKSDKKIKYITDYFLESLRK